MDIPRIQQYHLYAGSWLSLATFSLIEPMCGLSYITRTQLSKPNRNKIAHDDTHPIKTEESFKVTYTSIGYRFPRWGFFCYRTCSCNDRLSTIDAYQNSQRFKWIKCVRAGSIIRIYGHPERIHKVNVRIPECIRTSMPVPPHRSTLLCVSSFPPR